MNRITKESELVVGKSYWLRGRESAIASLCRDGALAPYFEEHVHAINDTIGGAFDRWEIWGPIPTPAEWSE